MGYDLFQLYFAFNAVNNMSTLSRSQLVKIFEYVPFEQSNWSHWALTCKPFLYAFEKALETSPVAASKGNFPIKRAALFGYFRTNKHLISKGNAKTVGKMLRNPAVNPAVSGNAPLHYAAWNGCVEVVKLLLKDPRVNPADLER
jgi:hypothetical protein